MNNSVWLLWSICFWFSECYYIYVILPQQMTPFAAHYFIETLVRNCFQPWQFIEFSHAVKEYISTLLAFNAEVNTYQNTVWLHRIMKACFWKAISVTYHHPNMTYARLFTFSHYNDVIMSAIASQITSLAIVYSTAYSGANQRKHQSSTSLAFVRGIHRCPVNSPHKGPVTRKIHSNYILHLSLSLYM